MRNVVHDDYTICVICTINILFPWDKCEGVEKLTNGIERIGKLNAWGNIEVLSLAFSVNAIIIRIKVFKKKKDPSAKLCSCIH